MKKGVAYALFNQCWAKHEKIAAQGVAKLTLELTKEGDLCTVAIFLVCIGWASITGAKYKCCGQGAAGTVCPTPQPCLHHVLGKVLAGTDTGLPQFGEQGNRVWGSCSHAFPLPSCETPSHPLPQQWWVPTLPCFALVGFTVLCQLRQKLN